MKTRTRLAATAATVMLSVNAYAADTTYYDPAPQPQYDYGQSQTPAQATNWQGLYAGVQLGGGRLHVSGDGSDTALVGGGHAGYLVQRGSIVVGPEVDVDMTGWSESGADVDAVLHAKLRAGVAVDNLLVTGSIGYGRMWASTPGGDESAGGLTVGAGADIAITDHVVGGADYLYTDINNLGSEDVNTHTLRTRLSYKFN